jgi:hypothetical protein
VLAIAISNQDWLRSHWSTEEALLTLELHCAGLPRRQWRGPAGFHNPAGFPVTCHNAKSVAPTANHQRPLSDEYYFFQAA